MKNNFTIKIDKSWQHVSKDEYECWFKGYISNFDLEGKDAANYILSNFTSEITNLKKVIKTFFGHFSFIVKSSNKIYFVTDNLASYPIFYFLDEKNFYVYTESLSFKKDLKIGSKDLNLKQSFIASRSGFTLGAETLYRGIETLEAGKILEYDIKNNKKYLHDYFIYFLKDFQSTETNNEMQKMSELNNILNSIFNELKKNVQNKKIIVFLSGGYDSRIIVSYLKEHNFKNVLCISYGQKGNWESYVSKIIADKLEFEWKFVEINHKEISKFYLGSTFKNYFQNADTFCSTPVLNELYVLSLIQNQIPKDSILINGQTGDFISGNHIPKIFFEIQNSYSEDKRYDIILDSIIKKHFSLWTDLVKKEEDIIYLKKVILEDIKQNVSLPRRQYDDYKVYEYYEWRTRQSRFLIRNQKVYDFFNFSWRLPLWDQRLVNFWLKADKSEKQNQNLWLRFIKDKKNIEVLIKYKKKWDVPVWINSLRFVLKFTLGVMSGKKLWHVFQRRFFWWWTDNQFKTAIISYKSWFSDRRVSRNAISYLTELWLKQNHLNWKGKKFK